MDMPKEFADRLNRAELTCAWLHRAITYKAVSGKDYSEQEHDEILLYLERLGADWFENFNLQQKMRVTANTQVLPKDDLNLEDLKREYIKDLDGSTDTQLKLSPQEQESLPQQPLVSPSADSSSV